MLARRVLVRFFIGSSAVPGVDHGLLLPDRDIGLYAVVVDQKSRSDQVIDCPQ